METELVGAELVALAELLNKEGVVVASVDDTCERVDPRSLPWLLEQGYIRHKDEPVKPIVTEEVTTLAELEAAEKVEDDSADGHYLEPEPVEPDETEKDKE